VCILQIQLVIGLMYHRELCYCICDIYCWQIILLAVLDMF